MQRGFVKRWFVVCALGGMAVAPSACSTSEDASPDEATATQTSEWRWRRRHNTTADAGSTTTDAGSTTTTTTQDAGSGTTTVDAGTTPTTSPTTQDAGSTTTTADAGSTTTTADAGSTTTTPPPPSSGTSNKVWGVTVDDVSNLSAITDSLQRLPHKPTTRIVFDEYVAATYYQKPATQIGGVSFVMGELLDSMYVKQYSTADYLARADEYLSTLGSSVDIWEIGNEINGEWLGDTATVVSKMTGAYDKTKAAGKTTALTLYYNQNCWSSADHEMFAWTTANVPQRMKDGLDYVLVSYYEDDCNGLQPDWNTVFNRLATMFPNSKIGFGECGTTKAASKATYVDRYYRMNVTAPRFVGGYFWWYFREDMVPYTNPLWSTLSSAMQ